MNKFAEAGRWLNAQGNERLNPHNIERPNTKWAFVKFSNIQVKVVLDRQPLLDTDALPDWLRSLAYGRQMVALDTFDDKLWRCIAVYQGRARIGAQRRRESSRRSS